MDVGGVGGFLQGVCVFPFFGVPFFLYFLNAIKSRRFVSRCSCGYVGTILVNCLEANCLADVVHSIVIAKRVGVPRCGREHL